MQVIIQHPGSGQLDDWAIVELQGDLESKSEEALGGKLIGDLHFNQQGKPIMIIGHHILHGKEQELDKPLVVIVKKPLITEEFEPDLVEYDVTAVIKRKYIFKTRPKPIVAEALKKV